MRFEIENGLGHHTKGLIERDQNGASRILSACLLPSRFLHSCGKFLCGTLDLQSMSSHRRQELVLAAEIEAGCKNECPVETLLGAGHCIAVELREIGEKLLSVARGSGQINQRTHRLMGDRFGEG